MDRRVTRGVSDFASIGSGHGTLLDKTDPRHCSRESNDSVGSIWSRVKPYCKSHLGFQYLDPDSVLLSFSGGGELTEQQLFWRCSTVRRFYSYWEFQKH